MAVLANVTKIFEDVLAIIYLHLYGIYAFAALPFRFLIPGKLKRLDDEIILVVGISSDLSKEICRQLGMTKTKLILWDSTESLAHFTKDAKGEAEVFSYEVNLSDRNDIEAVSNKVKQEIGDVTIVINTTEVAPVASFLSQKPVDIEKTFKNNILSLFWIAKSFLPKMIEKNQGQFVTIGSNPDSWGITNCIPYISSKCGVRGFMQSLEDETRNHLKAPDITFTTVITSFFRTKFFDESDNGMKSRYPSLLGIMDDKHAANKIVRGFRQNQEFIYIPGYLGVLLWLGLWVPTEFSRKMESFFLLNRKFDRNSMQA